MFRIALSACLFAPVTAAAALLRPVAPSAPSLLPAPALAPVILPAVSLAGAAASALPALAPTTPSVRPLAAPAFPAAALPVSAQAQAAPSGAQASFAAVAEKSAALADRRGGTARTTAVSAAFFDGAKALPDLVETAGLEGIVREIREPARLLQAMGVKGTVTVYGSARIPSRESAKAVFDSVKQRYGPRPKSKAGREALKVARAGLRASRWYEEARRFGRLVAERGGGEIAVVTGGGPGIMEGANRGAFEAGGKSVGYNITLDHEQAANPWITPGLGFEFANFTTRKMNLRHGAVGLAYFPGGFGTMDELFEVLTLMQTRKMPRVPIVLVGERAYWKKVLRFEEFSRQGLISPEDLRLFTFAEDAEHAWAAIVRGAAR